MSNLNSNDAQREFLDTLGSEPETDAGSTRRLSLPSIVPVIKRGPAGANAAGSTGAPGATDTGDGATEQPLEGSDAEAYAALKAKRAERRRKKLVRRGIIVGVAVAIVAAGAIAINVLSHKPEQVAEPVTEMAMEGTFSTTVDAKGTLQPLSSTVVTPEIDGQIESVNVVAGQGVKAGDVLMTIKNPDLDRAVAEAERGLRQARADLAAAQQGLRNAQNAPAEPGEDGGQSGQELVASAQQGVNAAQAALETAQAAYDDAVAKAALRTVKAPAAGSIVALNAQVGADLGQLGGGSGGTGTPSGPLMQIADLSKMKVTIQVSEEDIASVAVDQTATITCPAFADVALTGRVTGIASIASNDPSVMSYDGSTSPTFAVDILIDAPDARLKPGMTAQVTLTTQQIDNVVMVPTAALMSDDGQSYYVDIEVDAESHETRRVDVTVYAQNDDFAVIGRMKDAPADSNPDMADAPIGGDDVLVVAGGMPSGEGDGMASGGGMVVL
ncbi:MAG: efflux RND transporter periplasmic adaptor subunit [Coriobacteriaceae bacterium]|nr:efflux RND transporter periplasmic adaptor subunit [Coriobacteriaceae bacterium]